MQENNQKVFLPEVRESSVDKRQERSTWARLKPAFKGDYVNFLLQ